MLLNTIRKLNKFVGCNQMGCISIERKFKEKEVYNYLYIPEKSFKSKSTTIQLY